jgi:hypothetical protein
MERHRHDQRGGYDRAGPAHTDHPQLPLRPSPRRSSAPYINTQVIEFLKEHTIHEKIKAETHNRGIGATNFVAQRSLRDIWSSDRLRGFLRIFSYIPGDEALRSIRKNLLKILSILVAIRWSEWTKFSLAFLKRVEDPQNDRTDKSLPFPLEVLESDSFLGNEWGGDFFNMQYTFIPIVVEQGETREYPSWRRLPFIQSKSVDLGVGAYGVVTKEVIAAHQFKWKESGNLNEVRFSPCPPCSTQLSNWVVRRRRRPLQGSECLLLVTLERRARI